MPITMPTCPTFSFSAVELGGELDLTVTSGGDIALGDLDQLVGLGSEEHARNGSDQDDVGESP